MIIIVNLKKHPVKASRFFKLSSIKLLSCHSLSAIKIRAKSNFGLLKRFFPYLPTLNELNTDNVMLKKGKFVYFPVYHCQICLDM